MLYTRHASTTTTKKLQKITANEIQHTSSVFKSIVCALLFNNELISKHFLNNKYLKRWNFFVCLFGCIYQTREWGWWGKLFKLILYRRRTVFEIHTQYAVVCVFWYFWLTEHVSVRGGRVSLSKLCWRVWAYLCQNTMRALKIWSGWRAPNSLDKSAVIQAHQQDNITLT